MVIKKTAKRIIKRVAKAAKKRYFKGKGYARPKVTQMVKDVAMLKRMVNAEKKTYADKLSSAITVGQVGGNTSGHQILDITPLPAQGTTSVTRNGNSIKLNSAYYEFYFVKQSSATQATNMIIEFWKVPGEPYTATDISNGTAIADLFTPNEYVTGANIYDTVSSRRQDTFRNFKKVYTRKVYFPANQISGVTTTKLVKIPLKYGHHIKFAADGSQTVSAGQILVTLRMENGNKSTTTANTFGNIAVNGTNTGVSMNYSFLSYFIDN